MPPPVPRKTKLHSSMTTLHGLYQSPLQSLLHITTSNDNHQWQSPLEILNGHLSWQSWLTIHTNGPRLHPPMSIAISQYQSPMVAHHDNVHSKNSACTNSCTIPPLAPGVKRVSPMTVWHRAMVQNGAHNVLQPSSCEDSVTWIFTARSPQGRPSNCQSHSSPAEHNPNYGANTRRTKMALLCWLDVLFFWVRGGEFGFGFKIYS